MNICIHIQYKLNSCLFNSEGLILLVKNNIIQIIRTNKCKVNNNNAFKVCYVFDCCALDYNCLRHQDKQILFRCILLCIKRVYIATCTNMLKIIPQSNAKSSANTHRETHRFVFSAWDTAVRSPAQRCPPWAPWDSCCCFFFLSLNLYVCL